jgi:hypothetical protein
MGSLVYARRAAERGESIVGAVSLDRIGLLSGPGSTPSKPDVRVVGDQRSDALVQMVSLALGRQGTRATPFIADAGSARSRSDQWAFQEVGFPSVWVAGTGRAAGTEDALASLELDALARLARGLEETLKELCVVRAPRDNGT